MEPLPGLPTAIMQLAERLQRLPGIGPRSALNIAISISRDENDLAHNLAQAITDACHNAQNCRTCQILTDQPYCDICQDETRLDYQICVVEQSSDVPALERIRIYRGRYHVLQGLLSPLQGITPDRLTVAQLLTRLEHIRQDPMAELILALPATLEGDMTADYIRLECRQREYALSITQLRRGLARHSRLEYAHPATLGAAFNNRQTIDDEPLPDESP